MNARTGHIMFFFWSGYSWLASQVDLTGNSNSFIFLGTNLGWLIFPPIAGLIIFSGPGGVGVFLLALGRNAFSPLHSKTVDSEAIDQEQNVDSHCWWYMFQTLILVYRDLYCTIVSDWLHDEDGLDKEEFATIKRSDLRKRIPLLLSNLWPCTYLDIRKSKRVKQIQQECCTINLWRGGCELKKLHTSGHLLLNFVQMQRPSDQAGPGLCLTLVFKRI